MRFVRAYWQLRQAFPETEKGGIIYPRIYSVSNTIDVLKGKKQHLVTKCKNFSRLSFPKTPSLRSLKKKERNTNNMLEALPKRARQIIYVESKTPGSNGCKKRHLEHCMQNSSHVQISFCNQPPYLHKQMSPLEQFQGLAHTNTGAHATTGTKSLASGVKRT